MISKNRGALPFILHLSLIKGIGPKLINHLARNKPSSLSWEDMYNCLPSDFVSIFGMSRVVAHSVCQGLTDISERDKELECVSAYGASIVTLVDEHYPLLLKEIEVSPPLLYYKGILPKTHDQLLSVVGSRDMNFYGQQSIKKLLPDLIAHGVTIVSGGARGIDRAAHECAIDGGGKTIAVLGSGLVSMYPKSNQTLFKEIVDAGGALISSFPMHAQAHPSFFPQRNRIISGLSSVCLVVQAARKSGALITARYALDQGKEVCAVPGPIQSYLSEGCHELIKQGAMLVSSSEDLLNCFPDFKREEKSHLIAQEEKQGVLFPAISTEEKAVYECLLEPRSMDDIIILLGYSYEQVQKLLAQLQLEGYITQNFAGFWHQL